MGLMQLSFWLHLSAQILATARMADTIHFNRVKHNKPVDPFEDAYLINTPGCIIPDKWRHHRIVEANDCENSCGIRAVRVKRTNNDNIVKFNIDTKKMRQYFGNGTYKCYFKFAYRIPNDTLKYTKCTQFENGASTTLKHEVMMVACRRSDNKKMKVEYEDAYIFPKILEKEKTNINKDKSFNVLILGMDTMSRARSIQSLSKLVMHFQQNKWLDFRAFQKAKAGTYPNVMNLLTCKSEPTYEAQCGHNMSGCNHLMIWNEYKKRGYVTAYGEDVLPDTFKIFGQFKESPTDHYTRPMFLLDQKRHGNILCTMKRLASLQILDYAYHFVNAYRYRKFFGYFWLSSNSHDPNNLPTVLQDELVQFFAKLNEVGVLNNTIIFFIGDHGSRWGRLKEAVESYYDDRLPMLYMWWPYSFREQFPVAFSSLQSNQYRLTTHCEVYLTLWNILKLSDATIKITVPEECPACNSLLVKKFRNITCDDLRVHELWCSCHILYETDPTSAAATAVPNFFIQVINKDIPGSHIKSILRHHWYRHVQDKNVTYHVIVIQLIPNERMYEAVIANIETAYEIVGDYELITAVGHFPDTTNCAPSIAAQTLTKN